MGTRIAEDLRGKDPSDVYVYPEDRSLFSKAVDKIRELNERYEDRSVLQDVGEGLYNWSKNYTDYGIVDEQQMRDKSWGDLYSPRESLYDLTGGRYDVGGQLHDTAALALNIPSELLRFTGAGLAGLLPQNIKHGFGTGTGYGIDYLSESLLGTPDLWKDNPLRFQHEIAYDEYGDPYQKAHESYKPYIDEAWEKYLPDLMTEKAKEDLSNKSNDLMDWNTYWHENPGGSEEEFKDMWSDNYLNLVEEKYGDQLYDYADKKYKKAMMEKYGIYNPALLQGLESEEEMMGEWKDMGLDMEFGILDPLKNYFMEGMEDPWFNYSSPEMQEKLMPIQRTGEMIGSFGIPAAARAALKTGVKYGMPKAIERGIKEAFPGTIQLFGRGEAGIPRLANDRLWKKFINRGLISPINVARPYGGQFATVGTIAEMMDED